MTARWVSMTIIPRSISTAVLGVFELDLPMFTLSTQPVGHHLGLGWIATS
jgi:hypothetical protein